MSTEEKNKSQSKTKVLLGAMEESQEDDFHYKQNALAMRLQQRRPRKVLVEQGIIPPLTSPGAFYPQVQRLERARKEDYLNHAIQVRPERELLVKKHILEDTNASSSLVASQKDLKKAKLVDDLNDKIAFRPGVFELVERNIIPATQDVQEAIKGGQIQYKKIADFIEEDSSDALSPEQQNALPASPPLFQLTTTGVPLTVAPVQSSSIYTTKSEAFSIARSSSGSSLFTQSSSHPYLSRQSSKGSKATQSGLMPRMANSRKKSKDKPKFKKFKYHQYVPPDQQGKSNEKSRPASQDDTPYSRLLQQQQMYLQLEIMNKYSSQITSKRSSDSQQSSYAQQGMRSPPPAPPLTQTMKVEKPRNPNAPLTQSKLDEMKVSELKEELKQRGQKVTGTKEVLVERLKPFCVTSDSVFLPSQMESGNSNFSIASSSMLAERTLPSDGSHQQPATTMFNIAVVNPTTSNIQTAFPIDPSTVHSHKVARMPVPEQHKIIVEREKLTMPTWHHAGEARGIQTVQAPSQPSHSFSMSDEINKDKMLETQQKQINDLKRMVELHRKQLQQLHEGKPTPAEAVQVMTKPVETALLTTTLFQFPTSANTSNQQSTGQRTSNPAQPTDVHNRQNTFPPNYEQAFEMLNENERNSPAVGSREMVDDILELLTDNGDLPLTPMTTPVTRILLNDHNSYHGITVQSTNPPSGAYPHQSGYIAQEQAQLRRDVRQNQLNRLSQEFITNGSAATEQQQGGRVPDLAKMLVDSAGDVLMDTSNFPPVNHRYSNPNLEQQPVEFSRASARNSVDSGVVYSAHFSPMDTSVTDPGSRDAMGDFRLSTSSIDSGEPTLNAVSLSPATPTRLKHQQNCLAYQNHSPSRTIHQNSLVKSASQELLSSSESPSGNNNSMNAELGWLDLTLGSAVGGPPSPGNPFETIGLDDQGMQNSQHSNSVSNQGSQEFILNACLGDSSGSLNYPPTSNGLDPQSWDQWEGLLNSNYNS